jgi:hypothetical protein
MFFVILAINTLFVSLTVINDCVFVIGMACVFCEVQTEFFHTAQTSFVLITGEISYILRLTVMNFIMEQRMVMIGLWAFVFAK